MEIKIATSDADDVSPVQVAMLLEWEGYYVRSVTINDGERTWKEDEDPAPWR